MLCPNCNKEIDNDSRFCRYCGVEFIDEEETVIQISQHDNNSDTTEEEEPIQQTEEQPEENKKNKKTTKIQLFITLLVLIIIGAVLSVVAIQSDVLGVTKETVTDAEGEKIRPGKGTTEMSVKDVDGTIRTIKTDRSLLSAETILEEYTAVMNNLKTDAPAFSFVRYQNLPTEYQNAGSAANFVLPIIEKYVTSKAASEEIKYEKGNANILPLPDSTYGCLLTDISAIKNAYCEVLNDESYKIVLTLNDELNPPVLSAGTSVSKSAINSVFDAYDALYQITAISDLALNKIDFNYTDCTATIIYNPETMQVESLNMTMNIDITANTIFMEIKARIVDVCEFTQFEY